MLGRRRCQCSAVRRCNGAGGSNRRELHFLDAKGGAISATDPSTGRAFGIDQNERVVTYENWRVRRASWLGMRARRNSHQPITREQLQQNLDRADLVLVDVQSQDFRHKGSPAAVTPSPTTWSRGSSTEGGVIVTC
jgi:hypothetical protein